MGGASTKSNISTSPMSITGYGVATISRIDKILRLFCRILSLLQNPLAKETYNFNQISPLRRCLSQGGSDT